MTTVANPGGNTVGTYVHPVPIRFRDEHGNWQPVDTTLVIDGATVRPKAVKDEVRLSAGGNEGLLSVKTIRGSTRLTAPAKLPAPVLSGNTATYADAYGKGTDLIIEVTAAGIRQKIVLKERPTEPPTYRVPVTPDAGLSYRAKPGGGEVLDEVGGATEISPALMLDAAAVQSLTSGKISRVATTLDGSDLVYRPEAGFLSDPATAYPVTLMANPTPWYGAGYPSDTFVSNDPRFTVGSGQQNMDAIVAGRNNFDGESSYYIYRSYLKYDLSSAPFYGRPILNADVRPWNYITTHCGGPDDTPKMVVRRVTSDWALDASSPVNLRWNQQPSTTTAGQALKGGGVGRIRKAGSTYVHCSAPAQELYYTIEDIVQAWSDGYPNYGLQIAASGDTSGTSNFREFLSTEWAGTGGRGPVLFVEYDAPEPPTRGFFIPGPSDGTPPTDQEMEAHLTDLPDNPVLPVLNADQTRALREDAEDHFIQDSGFGFYPVEEITRERWLSELDPEEETAEPEPDSTPPVVTSTEPASGVGNVPTSAIVRVTFDEPISDPEFRLCDESATLVAGDMTVHGTSVSFAPAQPLAPSTTYIAEIRGAVDVDGNAMAAPYSWSFTTAATTEPPEGLVAAYGMNEGAGTLIGDASGKGNTGQARDTAWTTGRHGRALAFNGSTSWVTVEDSPSLRLDTGMTLSAWVRPTTLTNWRPIITKELSTDEEASYALYASNGTGPSGWLQLNADVGTVDATSPLPVGTWSHVAFTYDGATARLYVNGAQAAQASHSGSLQLDNGYLRIGGNDVWSEYFHGDIDEVRIYDRAQNAESILTDMNSPIGAPAGSARPPTDTGIRAAGKNFPYDRVEHPDCQKIRRPEVSHVRWLKNSFNACWTGQIGEQKQDGTGRWWSARISVIAHTYVGYSDGNTAARGLAGTHSRQIKVWIRVDKFNPGTMPQAAQRQFSVHVNNTSSCTSDKPQGILDSVGDWTEADRVITLTSPKGDFAAPDHFGYCGIQPSLFYPAADSDSKVKLMDNQRTEFRCDSSDKIPHFAGGCVLWSSRPTWSLDGNEKESEQTADHIWTALHDPQATDPKFPGQTKNIPGKINPRDRGCKSKSGCLTRSMSNRKTKGSVANNNYKAAVKQCNKLDKTGFTKPSCDEYPFASTHEGSAYAGINFSVAIVERGDNCSGGSKLKNWYLWNRVLEKDPFWVHVTKKGDSPPPHLIPADGPEIITECDE
ncbi:LamG-like jellyroll fold domain-containing protein [Spongiactinospora gelatinilytica]|nr:LamG-like jellyroll fold domain-containing protein [Spongiactinospora gelatinilytica]